MNRKTLLGVAGTACVASLAFYSLQAANTTPSQPAKPDAASQPASPDGGPKRFHKPFDKGQWGKDCQRGPGKFHRGGPDRRGGHGFDHGRGGPDTLRALNLTDEQKAKVKAVVEGDRAKIEAILKEQREKIEAVKAESEKAIRPILTEEQQSVFDDANKLREAGEKLRNDIRKLHADKDKAPKSE
jgi:Spy/CpxP family protein refolding chaperone